MPEAARAMKGPDGKDRFEDVAIARSYSTTRPALGIREAPRAGTLGAPHRFWFHVPRSASLAALL